MKSLFKKYLLFFHRLFGTFDLIKIQVIQQVAEYRRINEQLKKDFPDNPATAGKKVYSQTDEDGIIEEIFKRIPNNKTFLEIGIQTGVECNTMFLLLKGWKGAWVEGSAKYCKVIADNLGASSFKDKLVVINSFIDRDNITGVFKQANTFFGLDEIDFFSLDIDGNDYYIMEELLNNKVRPKVVCVEYNAKFAPPLCFKIKYDKTHVWDYSDYMGCSLQCYADLFEKHGYTLVCCNIPGINAFFVRNEFAGQFAKYPVDELYQPYRFYLSPLPVAQKPSLKYLKNLLAEN
jgi:hypothetical protein